MDKLCISIGVDNHVELKRQIDRALEKGRVIEIRFDYIKIEEMDKSIEVASSIKDRAIFTCRSREEGGMFKGNEEERLSIIKRFIDIEPMLIDIEFNTLKRTNLGYNNLLVSWHNFNYTPPINKLQSVLREMSKFSKHVKIVTYANEIRDNITILQLYNDLNDLNLIAFCMGELGIASRILSIMYGAPFTYTTLDKALAPGQLDVDTVKEIIRKIKVDPVILNRVIGIIDETIGL